MVVKTIMTANFQLLEMEPRGLKNWLINGSITTRAVEEVQEIIPPRIRPVLTANLCWTGWILLVGAEGMKMIKAAVNLNGIVVRPSPCVVTKLQFFSFHKQLLTPLSHRGFYHEKYDHISFPKLSDHLALHDSSLERRIWHLEAVITVCWFNNKGYFRHCSENKKWFCFSS